MISNRLISKQPLTELSVKNMECPLGLFHLEFFDPELSGFYIDVLRSGRKSYRLRYKNNKLLKVVTLGSAQNISLEQARKLAQNFLLKVSQGAMATAVQDALTVKGLTIEDFFNLNYLPFVKSYK